MIDALFAVSWPQATETRRLADRKRSDARASRARSGEMGAFAQAFQLEMDAFRDGLLRDYNTWSASS